MNILLIIFSVFLVMAFALMTYHLAHAPVGEETPEGFKETSLLGAKWGSGANLTVGSGTRKKIASCPSK